MDKPSVTHEPLVMLTIAEAAVKFGLAVHALRVWTRSGELPAVCCGRKFLINENVLREFLTKGNNQQAAEQAASGKIRRLY